MRQSLISRVRSLPTQSVVRILFVYGLLMLGGELYKQLFLYYVIEHGRYNWWFFPFQLCSLPMYFCLALPFLPGSRAKRIVCTFMQDFHLLGGIAALVVSDGFRHIHWSLTLHGYLWHLSMVLMALLIWASGLSDLSVRGYLRTLPLFAACCAAATAVNLLAPGEADMFYISPFHASTQLVFHWLSERCGILPGHLLYLAAVCLGAFLIHMLLRRLARQLN